MRKPLLLSIAVAALTATLSAPARAWGGLGHQYVTRLAIAALPESPFKALLARNDTWLAVNASHPDRWRGRPDTSENARHFLDTERFGHGTDIGKIPHAFADVLKERSYAELRGDGMNPWTVDRVYRLLVRALRDGRWDDALVQAAYLSHYVGDAHVPFHATENYDGQLSQPSQRGVHARFEERVLERTIKFEDLTPGTPDPGTDPIEATFATLQESLSKVPTLLKADRSAQMLAGSVDSDIYWTSFSRIARPIALQRLEAGGRCLAGLLQSAWREAGSPRPPRDLIARDTSLPYASPFVPRGQPIPPAQPPVAEPEKAAARSRAEQVRIHSAALDRDVVFTVLLPSDYRTSGKRYPVLYLLHGASGKHTDWNGTSGVAAYTEGLPLIVVMPDAQGDSFWSDTPGKGKIETFVARDLVQAIDRRYATIARREGRAVAGLSMGGYGSWKIALDHPRTFCAAASLSGVLGWGEGDYKSVPFIAALYPQDTAAGWTASQLFPRIVQRTGKRGYDGPALYFDCGKDDFLNGQNQEMERRLLERRIPYEFAEFPGAHTWEYWDSHIRDVLNFVLRHVRPAH